MRAPDISPLSMVRVISAQGRPAVSAAGVSMARTSVARRTPPATSCPRLRAARNSGDGHQLARALPGLVTRDQLSRPRKP